MGSVLQDPTQVTTFEAKENQKCMYSWITQCVGCNGYRECDGGAYANY